MDNMDRSAVINIGGTDYPLILTVRATKEIAKKYGGLETLGDRLIKSENFELALTEVVWLVTLLANQAIQIHNLRNPDARKTVLDEETVELLTTPHDFADYKDAILASMVKGTTRNVASAGGGSDEKNV